MLMFGLFMGGGEGRGGRASSLNGRSRAESIAVGGAAGDTRGSAAHADDTHAGAGAGAGGLRRQSSAAAAAEGETARKAAAEAALAQVLAAEADTGRCGRGAETDGTDGIDVHSTKKRLGSPYYFVCAHAVRVTIPRSPPAPAQSAEWVG
eukprot:COSAG01_NODE_10707_length_2097_cov_21.930931_4_plen_150_part_00